MTKIRFTLNLLFVIGFVLFSCNDNTVNQKEKTALRKKFPDSIFISNSKKTGEDRVHQEIFKTIFGEVSSDTN